MYFPKLIEVIRDQQQMIIFCNFNTVVPLILQTISSPLLCHCKQVVEKLTTKEESIVVSNFKNV